jgi:invasion protein IalB
MRYFPRITSLLVCWLLIPSVGNAEVVKFAADDWVTECDTAHETVNDDCSIIGVFRDRSRQGGTASFSLLIDLKNKLVAIVGEPTPTGSNLRIDKNAGMQCHGTPYCIFAYSDVDNIIQQLRTGSLILIDVFTGKGAFRFSLSAKGYRTGLAKLHAQGYRETRSY